MKKRVLSMLLAIIMVVGMLPGFALVASATDTVKTVLTVENGTVEFDATDVNIGDIITVTVKPDDGYVVNTQNLGGADAAVFVGANTFKYYWDGSEELIADFALIRGCAVYFDSTGAPNEWDTGCSRLMCKQEDGSCLSTYMLETDGDLWYAIVPDGTTAIYFQNYVPGQPEEYVQGGYQNTHTFQVEAGKTYICGGNLCADTDNDHYCDVCDEHMSTLCSDTNKDHACDVCEEWMSDCTDEEDIDFKCDICGEWMLPDPDRLNVDAEAGDAQITVTWTALSNVEEVYDNVTYSVIVTDEDGNENTYTTYNREGDACTGIITGLTNDVTYSVYVEVTCENWDGYSISYGTDVAPYSASATAPGAPTGVEATAGPEQITVTWTAPEINGGAKILGYEVEYAPKGAEDGNGGGTYAVDADTTSVTIEDLDSSTEYEIKVRAINAVGSGTYSDAVSATPKALTKYDIWVAGEQFAENNLVIYGDTGTATYDPVSDTLTLDNYTYTGNGYDGNGRSTVIYVETASLNIVLVGENKIVNTDASEDDERASICIYLLHGSLSISGTGSLTVVGGDSPYWAYGFYIQKDLTIEDCTVNVTAGNGYSGVGTAVVVKGDIKLTDTRMTVHGGTAEKAYGINCSGDMSVIQSDLAVSTGEGAVDSVGVIFDGDLTVEDSSLTVTSGDAGNYSIGIYAYYGTPSISFTGSTVTVVSGDAGDTSVGIFGYYGNPDFSIRNSTVTATSGTAQGNSCAVYTTGDIVLGDGMTIVAPVGGRIYQGNVSCIVDADDNFATNVVIGPTSYQAVWTDGDGASYIKDFKYGEVITIPTNEFFTDTFRKTGYTLTGWQNYTEGMTMPVGGVTFTAVYNVNKYTVTVPAEQIGYRLETDVTQIEHGGEVYISVALKEGYEKTDAFAVKVNGKEIELTEYNNVIVQATEDLVITVEGVALKTYVITFMDENGVFKTLNVKHGDKIEMPEPPTKEGYTVKWDTIIDTATSDATIKAVYTKNSAPVSSDPNSPQTGDNSNIWLWLALLFVSGTGIFTITVYDRKRKAASK